MHQAAGRVQTERSGDAGEPSKSRMPIVNHSRSFPPARSIRLAKACSHPIAPSRNRAAPRRPASRPLVPFRPAQRRAFAAGARRFSSTPASSKGVVFVDGVRIPFALSQTVYTDMMAYDLSRLALKGLLTKTALDPKTVDYVLYGTVSQEGLFACL